MKFLKKKLTGEPSSKEGGEGGDKKKEEGGEGGENKDTKEGGEVERPKPKSLSIMSLWALHGTALSTTPADWQIRIHVIEGRALKASNPDPVVRVQMMLEKSSTSIQKSTNSPHFDELLIINVHEAQSVLFKEQLEIFVGNGKASREDARIGTFSTEVGLVYFQPEHQYFRKWLMLVNPDDKSAGVMGYLKVSIAVMGLGDEAPLGSDGHIREEDEDIEENLLKPPGMDLEPLDLLIRCYRCADLPQMDMSLKTGLKALDKVTGQANKELCDPYCTFSFGERSIKTDPIQNSYNPEYNMELHLDLNVPSPIDHITCKVSDSDMASALTGLVGGGDDAVGTHFFMLNQISSTDEDNGFLPLFGPAWVCFYGAPREHETFESDHHEMMNEGLIEGCAYRGRALIELLVQTKVPNEEVITKQPLEDHMVERIQQFQKMREFFLRCVIYEAGMLPKNMKGKKVQFEASIGNNGNMFLEDDGSSMTAPATPVSDGVFYTFIPWTTKKPCLEITSEWEDISFRYYASNFLKSIRKNLLAGIELARPWIEKQLASQEEIDNGITALLTCLNKFSRDLTKPFPTLPEVGFTRLDTLVFELRTRLLEHLRKVADKVNELLQYKTLTPVQVIEELEVCARKLLESSQESQNSIPDLILWMVVEGKRKAYIRIPVSEVIFAPRPEERGPLFGLTRTWYLKWPTKPKSNDYVIPCRLQLNIRFGSVESQSGWGDSNNDYIVVAETFENQRFLPLKGWCDSLLPVDPPKYSDKKMKKERKKENVQLPEGWEWDGDWYVDPEMVALDDEAGLETIVEETFENMRRYPLKGWGAPLKTERQRFSDKDGQSERTRESVQLPAGWLWAGDWRVDMDRGVDSDGWEYAFDYQSGTWHPEFKKVDFVRRRRWIRERSRDPDFEAVEEDDEIPVSEIWEFSVDFHADFHTKKKTIDVVRRRRWHRDRRPKEDAGDLPPSGMDEASYGAGTFLRLPSATVYELRAHIYLARELIAADRTGLSDPYLIISCASGGGKTLIIEQNLCPTWDQVLVVDRLRLYMDVTDLETFPAISIEVFDHDDFGEDEVIGRTTVRPILRTKANPAPPKLEWYQLDRGEEEAGELLATFELIPANDTKFFPLPKRVMVQEDMTGKVRPVIRIPKDIRPVMEPCAIEILTWGLRKIKKYMFLSVSKPQIEFVVSGQVLQSEVLKVKKYPNCKNKKLRLELELPVEEIYTPPLTIRVIDNRRFGRKPIVGSHAIRSLARYKQSPKAIIEELPDEIREEELEEEEPEEEEDEEEDDANAITLEEALDKDEPIITVDQLATEEVQPLILDTKPVVEEEEEAEASETVDWWSKFYMSAKDHEEEYDGDLMEYYLKPLEKQFEIEDNVKNFTLTRGKKGTSKYQTCGTWKGNIRVVKTDIDPIPPPWVHVDDYSEVELIVRVYCIRGLGLAAADADGKSDPYIKIQLGGKKFSDRDNYIPKNLNPLFGRAFEFNAVLPHDSELTIRIYDWDLIGGDDLIGETKVDIEDRYLTNLRATCGLQKTYLLDGPNKWRDFDLPSKILADYCKKHGWDEPKYNDAPPYGVVLPRLNKGRRIKPPPEVAETPEKGKENSALMALHHLPLIKEHIETRRLENPLQPGMDQGSLQMWIDVFPKQPDVETKPIVNVAVRIPKPFELRCVIYNCVDVPLVSTQLGLPMVDLVIKAWLTGMEHKKQKTDVHYRSLSGEGNFNWRLLFPFEYLPAEKKNVVKKKTSFFAMDKTETKVDPIFVIQIWDNALFGPGKYIGSISLPLLKFPKPAKSSYGAAIDTLWTIAKQYNPFRTKQIDEQTGQEIPEDTGTENLFEVKNIKGWLPLWTGEPGDSQLAGKIELEIDLLTGTEAEEKPAGKGQKDPNQFPKLDKPNRPATSFNWITSPWKAFKFIIWGRFKWYIIGFLVLILFIFWLALFIYYLPPALTERVSREILPG